MSELRRRIARTRFAPAAALPLRVGKVARHNASVAKNSARWLVRSREHTNFTYELTDRNQRHLAWWIATVAGIDIEAARAYMLELDGDRELRRHIEWATAASPRRRLADSQVRYARRAGWYALIRATKPDHTVDTLTDKGLGPCVIAAALLRNAKGRLTTIDVNPSSGYLVAGRYAEVVNRMIGDSAEVIRHDPTPVDVFLHDSLHTHEHETAELAAVAPRLSEGALVLSDNADQTDALLNWSEAGRRRFLYFAERPKNHWHPGAGIGASFA